MEAELLAYDELVASVSKKHICKECLIDDDIMYKKYYIDLDNDNDGIPNVVELGLVDDNFDATVYNDTSNPWVDVNGNGVHDAYESVVPIDTDGDGTPDYLDLDSDNDGIFDNVEYDGYGDIDVSGDGLSEGSDYQDATVNNMSDDQDGDGILPQIDDNDDDTGTSHHIFLDSKINTTGYHKNPNSLNSLFYRLSLKMGWAYLSNYFKKNIPQSPKVDERTFNFLIDKFRDDISSLESLIDKDLSHWKTYI